MCRRPASATLLLLAYVSITDVGSAQGAVPDSSAYWQRRAAAFDVLDARLRRAYDSTERLVRAYEQTLSVDTVTIGRVRAIVRGIPAPAAHRLLRDADSLWATSWAAAVPPMAGAQLELVRLPTVSGQPAQLKAEVAWREPDGGRPRSTKVLLFVAPPSQPEAISAAMAVADLQLSPWRSTRMAGVAVPHMFFDTLRLARSGYEDFAASPFVAARSCIGGTLKACVTGLGLSPMVPPYDELLDADGRAALLNGDESRNWPVEYADRRACIDTRDDELCRRAFAAVPPAKIEALGITDARALFAARLLARTARDGRWLAPTPPTSSVGRDIRALAGDSLDAYVSSWRASLMAHRPRRVLPPAITSWIALMVVAVLAVLGMRSSRWRIS